MNIFKLLILLNFYSTSHFRRNSAPAPRAANRSPTSTCSMLAAARGTRPASGAASATPRWTSSRRASCGTARSTAKRTTRGERECGCIGV